MPLEARLYNPYLKVLGRETLAAMELLQEIRTGRYGAASRPNVETFNGIIEARAPPAPSCLHGWDIKDGADWVFGHML